LQSEFDITLYINSRRRTTRTPREGWRLRRRRRGPSNDQLTLSIHTTKVSQKKSDEQKERLFVTYPIPGLYGRSGWT
jgi:hypothetical protein